MYQAQASPMYKPQSEKKEQEAQYAEVSSTSVLCDTQIVRAGA